MDMMTEPTPSKASSETQTQPAAPAAASVEPVAPAAAAPVEVKPSEAKPATTATAAPAAPAAATPPAAAVPPVVAPVVEPEPVYAIKLPEGMEIDPELIPALLPALKTHKLSPAQLQGVAESFIKFQEALPARMLARDLDLIKKDPDLGGMNLARTQAFVNTALTAFTDAPSREWLQKAGIANRPELVRMFERIGRAMSSDSPERSQPNAAAVTSMADRLYGGAKKA